MNKRTFEGKVIKNKMKKTVVVEINVHKRHPLYNKALRITKTFSARDELGVALGDSVKIEECRPYSKTVTFKVVEKLEKQKRK
jgi:small subunit ribosomal protein S17